MSEAMPGDVAAALDRLAGADERQTAALDRLSLTVDRLGEKIEDTYVRRDLHDEQMERIEAEQQRQADTLSDRNSHAKRGPRKGSR